MLYRGDAPPPAHAGHRTNTTMRLAVEQRKAGFLPAFRMLSTRVKTLLDTASRMLGLVARAAARVVLANPRPKRLFDDVADAPRLLPLLFALLADRLQGFR